MTALRTSWSCVDLAACCNAAGITGDGAREAGAFNAWGNSYPAEELWRGAMRRVGGVPFQLPGPGAWDHVEALGQVIALPGDGPGLDDVRGLALLCSGEMGDQTLAVEAMDSGGGAVSLEVAVPGWLVEGTRTSVPDGHLCTHLHYPGGYELCHLKPVLWCVQAALPDARALAALRLGDNPLVHVFALTLLHGTVPHA